MSDRERDPLLYSKLYCQHCLLLLLALFCYWHHCDIGITGALSAECTVQPQRKESL